MLTTFVSGMLQPAFDNYKTVNVISQEMFNSLTPGNTPTIHNQEVPPAPVPLEMSGKFHLMLSRLE